MRFEKSTWPEKDNRTQLSQRKHSPHHIKRNHIRCKQWNGKIKKNQNKQQNLLGTHQHVEKVCVLKIRTEQKKTNEHSYRNETSPHITLSETIFDVRHGMVK